jgi:hypothetical protein
VVQGALTAALFPPSKSGNRLFIPIIKNFPHVNALTTDSHMNVRRIDFGALERKHGFRVWERET